MKVIGETYHRVNLEWSHALHFSEGVAEQCPDRWLTEYRLSPVRNEREEVRAARLEDAGERGHADKIRPALLYAWAKAKTP